ISNPGDVCGWGVAARRSTPGVRRTVERRPPHARQVCGDLGPASGFDLRPSASYATPSLAEPAGPGRRGTHAGRGAPLAGPLKFSSCNVLASRNAVSFAVARSKAFVAERCQRSATNEAA